MPSCDIRFLCKSFVEDLHRLERKHKHIRKLVRRTLTKLEANPVLGARIQPYTGCSKIKVTSDFRMIYYYRRSDGLLVPIALYAKNERPDVAAAEIAARLREFSAT